MSKLLSILLVTLLVLASCSAKVVVLGDDDFRAGIKKTDYTLVKFYAPWCGHCKKLAPEFEKASEVLEKATLAEVDCTVNKKICEEFAVEGYPTLFLLKNGSIVEKYSGGRTAAEIVGYMKSQYEPAMKVVSAQSEIDALVKEGLPIVIVKTANNETEVAKILDGVSKKRRASYNFVLVTSASVEPNLAMETVTFFHNGDKTSIAQPQTAQEVNKFLDISIVPVFGTITPENFKSYMTLAEYEYSIAYIFTKDEKECPETKAAAAVAQKFRDAKVLMVSVNGALYGGFGDQLGAPKPYPSLLIDRKRVKYLYPDPTKITEEGLLSFLEKFQKGEIPEHRKSDPIPEKETVDGLTTLVGKSFDKYVASGKDMLVLFYAPWCGHCKKLHPDYEKLAKEFEKEDVIIAKIDATTNDVDPKKYPVSGFPTIFYIPAGAEPVVYNRGRTAEDMAKYIRDRKQGKDDDDDDDL